MWAGGVDENAGMRTDLPVVAVPPCPTLFFIYLHVSKKNSCLLFAYLVQYLVQLSCPAGCS